MESRPDERNADDSRAGMWTVLGLTGALVVFLVGFLPPYLYSRSIAKDLMQAEERVSRAETRLTEVKFDLELSRLRGELGELLQAVNENNFGTASNKATGFFDGVRKAAANDRAVATSTQREALETVLAQRDEISSGLARADSGVKAKIEALYMQFASVTS